MKKRQEKEYKIPTKLRFIFEKLNKTDKVLSNEEKSRFKQIKSEIKEDLL
jgi:hypothetical protein